MGRTGDYYDDAVAESFFVSLKKKCLRRMHAAARTEAYDAIAKYVDGFCSVSRRHSALGHTSPIDYEAVTGSALTA